MSDSVLQRHAARLEGGSDFAARAEIDAPDHCGAFGWLRGIRDRATMLELRKRNGNVLAVGYGWLEKAEFDPSEGITLHVVGQRIRIKGRNLNADVRSGVRLFDSIVRHRASWVQEADAVARLELEEAAVTVDAIEW